MTDQAIIERIKAIGGQWDAETGRWLVPKEAELALAGLLAETGRKVQHQPAD